MDESPSNSPHLQVRHMYSLSFINLISNSPHLQLGRNLLSLTEKSGDRDSEIEPHCAVAHVPVFFEYKQVVRDKGGKMCYLQEVCNTKSSINSSLD